MKHELQMKEDTIILLAKEGKKEAFRWLYEQNKDRVFQIAYRYLHSRPDAEDIVQDTFIKAFRGIKSFDSGDTHIFSTWINRISVNCSIDHLRHRKTQTAFSHSFLSNPERQPKSPYPSPEKSAVASVAVNKLRAAVRKLTPKQRVMFDMRYSQHMDIKDIALSLHSSESNVKTQLNRSVKKLQKSLEFVWGKQ